MAEESFNEAQQPRRGRSESTQYRRERRRPEGASVDETSLKLTIPARVLEKYPAEKFVHRWFSSRPGRLEWAHRNDWDRVDGVDQVAATDKDGREAPHILHIKYREWYEADRAHLESNRVELEKQMARGKVQAKGEDGGETLSSEVSYADTSNRLR